MGVPVEGRSADELEEDPKGKNKQIENRWERGDYAKFQNEL